MVDKNKEDATETNMHDIIYRLRNHIKKKRK